MPRYSTPCQTAYRIMLFNPHASDAYLVALKLAKGSRKQSARVHYLKVAEILKEQF